jgi:hypothetical protein
MFMVYLLIASCVEVQVGRELFRLLVEDVERSVEVVDEEAAPARLVAKVNSLARAAQRRAAQA